MNISPSATQLWRYYFGTEIFMTIFIASYCRLIQIIIIISQIRRWLGVRSDTPWLRNLCQDFTPRSLSQRCWICHSLFVFCMMLWSFQFFHKHFGFSLELLFPNVVVEVHVNTLTTHSRDVRRCMIENMTISVWQYVHQINHTVIDVWS